MVRMASASLIFYETDYPLSLFFLEMSLSKEESIYLVLY